MSLANQKGSWQKASRRALAALALVAVTFVGHSNLRGEELQAPTPPGSASSVSWQSIAEVREALAPASDLSPASSSQGGSLIPLTELERDRSIYW